MTSPGPSVLIVDDNTRLADRYGRWLSDAYTVEVVYSGEEALTRIDNSFDIVLLDGRMPGLSGEEVLASIREDNPNCSVVLVTTVEPDFDILDLGFDAYLEKEVIRDGLHRLVESLSNRMNSDDRLREYLSLCSKRAALASHKESDEWRNRPGFGKLEQRLAELESELDGMVSEFTENDFRAAFHRIP